MQPHNLNSSTPLSYSSFSNPTPNPTIDSKPSYGAQCSSYNPESTYLLRNLATSNKKTLDAMQSQIRDTKYEINSLECYINKLNRSIEKSFEDIMQLCFKNSRKLTDYAVSQDSQQNLNSILQSQYNKNTDQIKDLTKRIQELEKKRTTKTLRSHQQQKQTAINNRHASGIKKNAQKLNKLNTNFDEKLIKKSKSHTLDIKRLETQIQELKSFMTKQELINHNNSKKIGSIYTLISQNLPQHM